MGGVKDGDEHRDGGNWLWRRVGGPKMLVAVVRHGGRELAGDVVVEHGGFGGAV